MSCSFGFELRPRVESYVWAMVMVRDPFSFSNYSAAPKRRWRKEPGNLVGLWYSSYSPFLSFSRGVCDEWLSVCIPSNRGASPFLSPRASVSGLSQREGPSTFIFPVKVNLHDNTVTVEVHRGRGDRGSVGSGGGHSEWVRFWLWVVVCFLFSVMKKKMSLERMWWNEPNKRRAKNRFGRWEMRLYITFCPFLPPLCRSISKRMQSMVAWYLSRWYWHR